MKVLVTGGAGYVGMCVVAELAAAGHDVRVLDVLLHGQEQLARRLEDGGTEVLRADIRDQEARRRALEGCDAVVHLAAIVGDPACALDPPLSNEVNVEGTRALAQDAAAAGVRHVVFASTCSNYGRMADPTVPVTEEGELRRCPSTPSRRWQSKRSSWPAAVRASPPLACGSRRSTGSLRGCASTSR